MVRVPYLQEMPIYGNLEHMQKNSNVAENPPRRSAERQRQWLALCWILIGMLEWEMVEGIGLPEVEIQ